MRPRKPGTKTGSGAAWGSGLDTMDTHRNLKNPKKPQKCLWHTSDILMRVRTWILSSKYRSIPTFILLVYIFVCPFPPLTSHIQAGWNLSSELLRMQVLVQRGRKWWIQVSSLAKNTKMQKIPSHETLTPHLRISLIEKGIGHFSTLAGGNLLM